MSSFLSKKMKYFIVSMETRCVNLAAEQLCITRSPLGKVLKELEGSFGSRLFIRKYNKLEPTQFALELYEKIKPLYDTLCCVENEFSQRSRTICMVIMFDISVPWIIFQHFVHQFKMAGILAACRRVSVTAAEVNILSTRPGTALITYREIHPEYNVSCQKIKDEGLVILMPEKKSIGKPSEMDETEGIPLFVPGGEEFFSEVKGLLYHYLNNLFAQFTIRRSECDIAALLFSVSTGNGAVILTEYISSCFNVPGIKKIKIPDAHLNCMMYLNNREVNKGVVEFILKNFAYI